MSVRIVVRLAATVAVGTVVCGGLGTLAGALAAAPLHGTAHRVVWAVVGTPVVLATGFLAERLADRRGWL
ncbi:hypothetical protein AB0D11_02135 [Streptomyces monashensis]|uniref:hypothetical protein n=1 Tax=Streptomyces monashensis TaxID=1678012 RepID=UPI0033C5262D